MTASDWSVLPLGPLPLLPSLEHTTLMMEIDAIMTNFRKPHLKQIDQGNDSDCAPDTQLQDSLPA